MKLRTLYAPAHFGNFYELSNYHEMRALFREWKAWGINGYSTWFNPHNAVDPFGKDPLYRWAREQPLKAWQRKRTLLLAAQDEGLELGLCVTPNAVYIDQLTPAGAATVREGHTTGPDLCLSHPASRQVIVTNFVNLLRFLKEGGVRLSHLDVAFRDWGGCDCAACAPWVQTVLTLWEKDLMPEALRLFPEIKVLFATWWVDDAEMKYFHDLLDRKPSWLDGLNISCGYTTKLPALDVRPPYRKTVFLHIAFSSDSFAPGTEDDCYGVRGAEVAPVRLQTIFRTMADLGYDGCLAYSEGIYDDLNKCLVARLAQDPRQEVRPLVAEYCRRYFGTDAG
ncbi:MAG: hypothetical protein PHR35_17815, partial [Kiritimatiellae bacterium]|nr:hypothetical protein [Kiritimatiellia bacterium]